MKTCFGSVSLILLLFSSLYSKKEEAKPATQIGLSSLHYNLSSLPAFIEDAASGGEFTSKRQQAQGTYNSSTHPSTLNFFSSTLLFQTTFP